MRNRFLPFLLCVLGFALITWPGGASAQGFDPYYGPPPGYEAYGSPMGYRGPPEPPSCRVQNGVDYGGEMKKCAAIADRLNGHIINYECDSFCIWKLSSRNVCVTRDARFGFHGVSYGGPYSKNINPKGNAMFLARLPRSIRAWAIRHGALNSKGLTYMSGSEAIALGIRECPRG